MIRLEALKFCFPFDQERPKESYDKDRMRPALVMGVGGWVVLEVGVVLVVWEGRRANTKSLFIL